MPPVQPERGQNAIDHLPEPLPQPIIGSPILFHPVNDQLKPLGPLIAGREVMQYCKRQHIVERGLLHVVFSTHSPSTVPT